VRGQKDGQTRQAYRRTHLQKSTSNFNCAPRTFRPFCLGQLLMGYCCFPDRTTPSSITAQSHAKLSGLPA
jgi:hypothetical protein